MFECRSGRGCFVCLVGLCCALGAPAVAKGELFHLRYDADVFPEDAGFTRFASSAGEIRTLSDGVLDLDTRASASIFDLYRVQSASFDLQDGQSLELNWRMRTLVDTGDPFQTDVTVFLTNGASAYVELRLGPDFVAEDEILGNGEVEHILPLAPGVYHEYSLVTSDMQGYALRVDDQFAFAGNFHNFAFSGPHVVSFGDAITGLSSRSQWDYVEIRVAPEPSSMMLAGVVVAGLGRGGRHV